MYIDYSYNGKLKGERVSRDLFYCFKIIASGYGVGNGQKNPNVANFSRRQSEAVTLAPS